MLPASTTRGTRRYVDETSRPELERRGVSAPLAVGTKRCARAELLSGDDPDMLA